jgi:hypothetical protein
MAETTPTLTQLEIDAHLQFLTSWVQTNYPDIDVSVGSVFHDLLLAPAIAFRALELTDIDNVRNSQSLLQVSSDPNLASNEIVDNIMSNFNVVRIEGSPTTGVVMVKLDRDVTTIIPQTAVFTFGSFQYSPTATFTAVSSVSLVDSDTDRLITQQPNSDFFVTIDVVASAAVDGDSLKKNTELTFSNLSQNIIGIVAYSDFKSGVLTEDNVAIIDRLQDGITAKVLSGREHIIALLNQELERKVAMTIIGLGDPEMSRDTNNMFGISHGGRVDCYVKTNKTIITKLVTIQATVTNAGTNELTLTVPADAYPGYYYVEGIFREDNPNAMYIADSKVTTQVTPDGYDYTPLMRAQDFNFSVFKETEVVFTDPLLFGGATNGDLIDYVVSLPGLPDLDILQKLVSSDAARNPAADYLIKPAIPFVVQVSLTIHYKENAPDIDAIKDKIVNNVDLISLDSSTLAASLIIDSCHDFLENSDYVVTPIDMAVTAYLPDETILTFRSGTIIRITANNLLGVSGRTACFFISHNDITINLVQENTI